MQINRILRRRVSELLEAMLPDLHERFPLISIAGVQRGKVGLFSGAISRHQIHRREFEASEEFAEK
jgi:hypothetical protein